MRDLIFVTSNCAMVDKSEKTIEGVCKSAMWHELGHLDVVLAMASVLSEKQQIKLAEKLGFKLKNIDLGDLK